MKHDELVKRLRCQLYGNCPACVNWYTEEVEPNLWRERCVAIDAADAIEELLQKTQQLPRWISVTERLPKYGTPVLAYGSRGGIFIAKYERARAEWDIDYWWKLNSSIHVCNPTHWMPLPPAPKEE